MPGCHFTWAPSQILPGEGWGATEDASGAVAASALAVDESLKALADPPASQPGPRLVTHPQLQARLPPPAPRCEQEPCSQLCCPWGQLSSAELTPRLTPCMATDHQAGSCPSLPYGVAPCCAWPQTTGATAPDHHSIQGSLVTGAPLSCLAPSCTNSPLTRLAPHFTEDCEGTNQLDLTRSRQNPTHAGFCDILNALQLFLVPSPTCSAGAWASPAAPAGTVKCCCG